MKAIAYIRVSRVGGREGDSFLSPQLQRESIEGLARREGLEIVSWLEELDASGGDATRPKWNEAIEAVERGEAAGIACWNISRFSRSIRDFLNAIDRIEAAGGRLFSATEEFGDDPAGRMTRNVLLSIAEMERERARAGFRAADVSAIERGIFVGARIPLGYRRRADRGLEPDPDTAPVVQGIFERRAKGLSWAKLARWAGEQGAEITDKGVAALVRNPTYTGQVRWGEVTKDDAHVALVSRALFNRCQARGKRSARTGLLEGRFLLQGVATCAACGRALYLTSGGPSRPFYYCRGRSCEARAYARAQQLDAFVLNTIEESENPADPSAWVARPGAGSEVEDAEQALADARADLDGWLGDTKLRGILGGDRYADATADRVAVVNKCESDLEAARRETTGGFELVGRLWNTEWGHAERREWVARMVRSCEVSKGREPLSRRVEVELR